MLPLFLIGLRFSEYISITLHPTKLKVSKIMLQFIYKHILRPQDNSQSSQQDLLYKLQIEREADSTRKKWEG